MNPLSNPKLRLVKSNDSQDEIENQLSQLKFALVSTCKVLRKLRNYGPEEIKRVISKHPEDSVECLNQLESTRNGVRELFESYGLVRHFTTIKKDVSATHPDLVVEDFFDSLSECRVAIENLMCFSVQDVKGYLSDHKSEFLSPEEFGISLTAIENEIDFFQRISASSSKKLSVKLPPLAKKKKVTKKAKADEERKAAKEAAETAARDANEGGERERGEGPGEKIGSLFKWDISAFAQVANLTFQDDLMRDVALEMTTHLAGETHDKMGISFMQLFNRLNCGKRSKNNPSEAELSTALIDLKKFIEPYRLILVEELSPTKRQRKRKAMYFKWK